MFVICAILRDPSQSAPVAAPFDLVNGPFIWYDVIHVDFGGPSERPLGPGG